MYKGRLNKLKLILIPCICLLFIWAAAYVHTWAHDASWKSIDSFSPDTTSSQSDTSSIFYIKGSSVNGTHGYPVLREDLWSITSDGSDKKQLTRRNEYITRSYATAPSHQAVAYQTAGTGEDYLDVDLWYYNTNQKSPFKITTLLPKKKGTANSCPVERCYTITGQEMQWSADSRYIIFLAAPNGTDVDIYVADTSEGKIRQVTFTRTQKHSLSILPDKHSIRFCEYTKTDSDGPCYILESFTDTALSIRPSSEQENLATQPSSTSQIDGFIFKTSIDKQYTVQSQSYTDVWELVRQNLQTSESKILDEGEFMWIR
jgi:hypothetical protein